MKRVLAISDHQSKVKLQLRQKVVDMLRKEYERLHPSDVNAAHETALASEKQIHTDSTASNYQSSAAAELSRLRQSKPVEADTTQNASTLIEANTVQNASTVKGQEASYPSTAIELEILEPLILTPELLQQLDFPIQGELKVGHVQSGKLTRQCDRCNHWYLPMAVADMKESDFSQCVYHAGRLRKYRKLNEEDRRYACCEQSIGTVGCCIGKSERTMIVIWD